MEIHKLTDEFSASPQIMAADVPDVVAAGFKSVICNRPNGESPDQPCCEDIEAAVTAAGLKWRAQPIVPGAITLKDAKNFAAMFSELPKPVLAYCRSGTRCVILWGLSQMGSSPLPDILSTARGAGYDVAAAMEHILSKEVQP